jgi:predicted alpha/beta superfamily hydrolase
MPSIKHALSRILGAIAPLLLALCFVDAPRAQTAPTRAPAAITLGHRESIHSKVLGEDREILISVPSSAMGRRPDDHTGARYPVLVLLDGPYHFHHTTGTVNFLAKTEQMPALIVVGVANTNRTHDLTPFADDEMTGSMVGGGADDFLAFLCDELLPSIDSRYPTAPLRLLIGHSLGGLFAMHTLTARPGFFRGIVAISPSMQWANQKMVGEFEEWLQQPATAELAPTSLFITAGNEGIGLLGGSMKASGLLSEHAPASLRWRFTHHPGERHNTVVYPSTVDGLRWIFDGWRLDDMVGVWDLGGLAAVDALYARARERLGFDTEVPASISKQLVNDLAKAKSSAECVELIEHIGPERLKMGAMSFAVMANMVLPKADVESRRRLLAIGLEQAPEDAMVREAAKELGLELPPMPEEEVGVTVAAEVLAAYVGRYEGDSGVGVSFSLDQAGDVAVLKASRNPGSPGSALVARSQTEFKGSFGRVYTFRKDAAGKVLSVEFAIEDREFVLVRKGKE